MIGKIVLGSMAFLLAASTSAMALTDEEKLGKMLYFDKDLSKNKNQACASCHHPSAGWADPLDAALPDVYPVSPGSDRDLNGCRNAPPSGYAAFIPVFDITTMTGGQFWDGREDTLKDQAKGPFLNPVEMAMPDEAAVIAAIAGDGNPSAKYYTKLFKQVYNINLQTINYEDEVEVLYVYDKVAQAIGTFEQTQRFTRFSSKYDYYLAGQADLTPQEMAGLALFEGAANCSACHPSEAAYNADGTITPPLFSDYTYDNLGVPKNTNPMIVDCPTDYGLGDLLSLASEDGKFKVSSLRNIAKTPPYAHNGYFVSLQDIVHFYNTRDVEAWPAPEVSDNLNTTELGSLGLSADDEAALVAFLMTLTDGYQETMPASFVLPPITPLTP